VGRAGRNFNSLVLLISTLYSTAKFRFTVSESWCRLLSCVLASTELRPLRRGVSRPAPFADRAPRAGHDEVGREKTLPPDTRQL
jgi:hypothetical protein